jgi:8-hydroxy-5-deazaflavin:NADPH oxidoreductase
VSDCLLTESTGVRLALSISRESCGAEMPSADWHLATGRPGALAASEQYKTEAVKMKIGVLGAGEVGGTVGRKLAALGHKVVVSSRHPKTTGRDFAGVENLSVGTPQQAAAHGEWLVNALPGEQAIDVLRGCAVDRKILIDISNYMSAADQPIEVPLGEAIQRTFPSVRLVKTLNSVSAHLMVDPGELAGHHQVFIASNDERAKQQVTALLRDLGWAEVIDLGDLGACRAMEQLIPLWVQLHRKLGGPNFNFSVIRE